MSKRSSRWSLPRAVGLVHPRMWFVLSLVAFCVGEVQAGLSVDSILNKYTLYGRKGISIGDRANTAKDSTLKGAWVGSDGIIDLKGLNNIGSSITTRELLFEGNGQDTVMGMTDVRDSLSVVGASNIFHGLVNVEKSAYLAQYDSLQKGLYIGNGPVRVNQWALGHVWNGIAIPKEFWNTKTSWAPADGAISGVYWNAVRPHEAYGMPFPDTSLTVGATAVAGSAWQWQKKVFKCGDQLAYTGSALTASQCRDTVLPEEGGITVGILQPGSYGDLRLVNGATLYLGEGVYSFNSISMDPSDSVPTALLALQPHSKRTVIYIKTKLDIGASTLRSMIAPARAMNYATRTSKAYGVGADQFAGGTLMIYSEATDLTFNNYLDLWATVAAPSNTVYVKEGFHLYGQIFADSIAIDNNFKGTEGAFIPWFENRPKVNFSSALSDSVVEPNLKADGATPDTAWAKITVTMDHINGDAVTIWYHTVDGTAMGTVDGGLTKNGTRDYVSKRDSLVIPATSLSGTIRIAVLGDLVYEGDEYFKIKIDSIHNADLGSKDTAKVADSVGIVKIIDNDFNLSVRLIPQSGSAQSLVRSALADTVFRYRLQVFDPSTGKTCVPNDRVTVRLVTTAVAASPAAGAVNGTDFVYTSPTTYVFDTATSTSKGDSDLAISIVVPKSSEFTPKLVFQLRIDTVLMAIKADSVVADTILPSPAHLAILGASAVRSATPGTLAMRTVLVNDKTGAITTSRVPLVYTWGTLNGSAVSGTHFSGISGKTDTLLAGAVADTDLVAVLATTSYDSTRHFQGVLTPVSAYAGLATSKDTAIDTLTCGFGKPTISIRDTSVQRQATDIVLKFPVRLSRTSALNPVYSYTAIDGGAVNGTDYVLKADTSSIASTDTISITIKGGTYFDTTRTFWVTLPSYDTSTLATVAQGSDTVAKITITSPVTSVRLLVDDAAATRSSDASIVFPVRVVDASDTARRITTRVALPFTWSTVDGSAIAGREFKGDTAVAGTVLAGDSGASLAVTVLHTAAYDSTRHFQVVTVPGSLAGLSTIPDTAVGTLRNGNLQPQAFFQIPSWTTGETPEHILWIPVRLSAVLAVPETLLVSADASGSAALAGRDYALLQPSDGGLDTTLVPTASVTKVQLVVPAGDSLVWVPLRVLRDSLDKVDHHVRLRLALASGLAPVDTSRDTSTVTFLNADASAVSFWKDTLTVKDADGAATIQLLLDAASHVATQASVATLVAVHDLGLAADSSVVLPFASGSTSASFVLTWGNDHKVGSDRVFDLHLVGLQGLVRGADSVLHVRIINTNVAPVVKITSPAEGAHLGKKDLDASGKVLVAWNVDGKVQTPYDTLLPEGKSTISKCYTDAWGNVGCDSVHVWLDTTPPKVVIDSVSKDGGKTWIVVGDTPWVNVPGVLVKWHSIDGGVTSWHQDTAKLTDTLNTVTRCIEDAVGNKGCGSGLVGLDTIPPKVWITTPPNGSQWPVGCVAVTYFVQDGSVMTQHDTTYCSEVLGQQTITTPVYVDRAGNAASGSTTITMIPNTPSSAKYIDSDGDGRIDEVIVQFPSKVVGPLPNFDISYGTPGANTASSSSVSYAPADSSVLVVKLSTPFPYGWTSSSVTNLGVIKGTNAAVVNGQKVQQSWTDTFDIVDAVAPVIEKSEVHRSESYTGKDTLWIYPSEPIRISGADGSGIFQVSLDSGKTWTDVKVDSVTSTGALRIILDLGTGVKPGVLIRFSDSVADASGNRVRNSTSPAVMIQGPARSELVQLELSKSVIDLSTSATPAKGGFTFLASSGDTSNMTAYQPGQGYASSATTSEVCPDVSQCAATTIYVNRPSTVQVYIYDQLGTYVAGVDFIVTAQDLATIKTDVLERTKLQMLWNLRTKSGRPVVSGIYLMHVIVRHDTYDSNNAGVENHVLKLGVKAH